LPKVEVGKNSHCKNWYVGKRIMGIPITRTDEDDLEWNGWTLVFYEEDKVLRLPMSNLDGPYLQIWERINNSDFWRLKHDVLNMLEDQPYRMDVETTPTQPDGRNLAHENKDICDKFRSSRPYLGNARCGVCVHADILTGECTNKNPTHGIGKIPSRGLNETLKERGARYGAYISHANLVEEVFLVLEGKAGHSDAILNERAENWQKTPSAHRHAIRMIIEKVCRAISGDHTYKDNWRDIQGYAKLIEDSL